MLLKLRRALPVLALALAAATVSACGGSSGDETRAESSVATQAAEQPSPTTEPGNTPAATPAPAAAISVDVSVYVVDGKSESLKSSRTVEDVRTILERVNEIWEPAGIAFDVVHVARVTAPDGPLEAVVAGRINQFLSAIGTDVALERPSTLNLLYVRAIGGPNGIAPGGTRVALVMDTPSVDDERVSAHELGHHLGLHHVLGDQGRLMFPGTNGRGLSEEEALVASYVARGLLDGVR